MRLIAVLALLVAAGGAAAETTCPTSAEGFARPVETHPTVWSFTEGPDRVAVGLAPSWVRFDALGGDDAVFVVAPAASATVTAGAGADVVVVCALREASLQINVGEDEAVVGDGAPDLIVIEPGLFLGAPPGVTIQIMVQGFTKGQDRIRLRLPPGVTPQVTPRPGVTLLAGPLQFLIAPVDDPMPAGAESFEIEQVAAAAPNPWPAVAPAFSGYDPGLGCASAPPAAAVPARLADGFAIFAPSAGPLRIEVADDVVPQASDAADRLLAFGGLLVSAGAGADQIVVCDFAGDTFTVHAGPGSVPGLDLDPDTIVIDAGRLQGPPRRLTILNVNPVNDRVVLRVPPGLEPAFEKPRFGMGFLRVGTLEVHAMAQIWERGLDYELDHAAFAVDRVAAP